jgi:DNA repair exonuclease SbcCD nuclease subunit
MDGDLMRIVHAADIHLDSPLRSHDRYGMSTATELRGATRRALENLVHRCIEWRADLLVIAGDLYDGTWNDYGTGLFFTQQMGILRDAGIDVVLVSGNHDAESEITASLVLPPNVRRLDVIAPESLVLDDLGCVVHGQGYVTRDITENLAKSYPSRIAGLTNIGVLHTAVTGAEGHALYAPCTPAELAALRYDYFALGHVHNRQVVNDGEFPAWFSGNLQGRTIRETGPKGVLIVDFDEGQPARVQFAPVDVLRWETVEVDVTGMTDLDDVYGAMRTQLANTVSHADGLPVLAHVRLQGASSLAGRLQDVEQLEAQASSIAMTEQAILARARSEVAAPSAIDPQDERAREHLLAAVRELAEDPEALKAHLKELDRDIRDLVHQSPGVEGLDLDDVAVVSRLLDRAQRGLDAQLAGGST